MVCLWWQVACMSSSPLVQLLWWCIGGVAWLLHGGLLIWKDDWWKKNKKDVLLNYPHLWNIGSMAVIRYVCMLQVMCCYSHKQISLVVADNLDQFWSQDISNHHDDVGEPVLRRSALASCSPLQCTQCLIIIFLQSAQTQCPFSWMKSFVFCLKFHWSLFLRVHLKITQYWFR